MTRRILLCLFAVIVAASAMAQIPAEVKEVLKKCEDKMASYNTPAGSMIDANIKMKVSVISLSGPIKMGMKGDKYFTTLSMYAMKKEMMKIELGFDGAQKWEYVSTSDDKKNDTLKITRTQSSKNSLGVKIDYAKDYRKAKMKVSGRYYEITFSGPLRKGISKKATIKIDKESYLMREYSVNENLVGHSAQFTVTITKLTRGCPDSWLKLDMNRYKNAKVVRR
jgi:hypothetical protein